jgi:hypothetical protein
MAALQEANSGRQWSTAVLPLYSVTVLFRVGYLVSDLSFDDRAKLSTKIVA